MDIDTENLKRLWKAEQAAKAKYEDAREAANAAMHEAVAHGWTSERISKELGASSSTIGYRVNKKLWASAQNRPRKPAYLGPGVSPTEAAKILDITRAKVYSEIEKGNLGSVKSEQGWTRVLINEAGEPITN